MCFVVTLLLTSDVRLIVMPVLNAVDLQCNEQSVLTAEVDAKEKARRYHELKVVRVCLYAHRRVVLGLLIRDEE